MVINLTPICSSLLRIAEISRLLVEADSKGELDLTTPAIYPVIGIDKKTEDR